MQEFNNNSKATIGTTASVASIEKDNNNIKRSSIIITNTSTGGQTISLGIDEEAVAGEGIVLGVGSVWADTRDGLYFPTQKYISAISSAAGGTIAIQERMIK